ncbi:uncharacterized protein B0I36DRAFT_327407 [Microdochium trichocladiopsis]|uniref:Fe2OG dioxygenase domain-containing protein n=1 Tax=Microdochium trichocladiopsis TaxID=1682393 RepID=A0A9P9BNC8_9PEZI|nr:uncharacterized protein B0I36DRAFT_327407 [Microdochium trichocladiopsis]KAH7027581.1 hypothetical protein B0I36DRAFT_327407 [Microdochium trichocladiopsis]
MVEGDSNDDSKESTAAAEQGQASARKGQLYNACNGQQEAKINDHQGQHCSLEEEEGDDGTTSHRPPRQSTARRQRRRRPRRRDERQQRHASLGGRPPDQVCLQYYPPGTGIPPHVDTHSTYDELYALSLSAPVLMQFRLDGVLSSRDNNDNNDNNNNTKKHGRNGALDCSPVDEAAGYTAPLPELPPKAQRPQVEVDLLPRSMLEMSGDSRLHWTHGIKPRKTDTLKGSGGQGTGGGDDGSDGMVVVRPRGERWSITYRWLREETPAAATNAAAAAAGPSLESKSGSESGSNTSTAADAPDDQNANMKPVMVRECECGDILLCDTAQRRRGQEREYRWKQYDAASPAATASPAPAAPAASPFTATS